MNYPQIGKLKSDHKSPEKNLGAFLSLQKAEVPS
jgi:hypothetical protein